MGGEQALERSVLERKERDELHTIAEALGVKPGTRTKKADLIQTILVAAGVEPAAPAVAASTGSDAADAGDKPRRARTPRAKAAAAPTEVDSSSTPPSGDVLVSSGGEADETGDSPTREGGEEHRTPPSETERAPQGPNGDSDMADALGIEEAIEDEEQHGNEASARPERGNGQANPNSSPPQGNGSQGNGSQPPRDRAQGNGNQSNGNQGNGNQGNGNQGNGSQGSGNQGQQGAFDDGTSRRSRRRRGRDGRPDREFPDRNFRAQEQTAEQQYQGDLVAVAGLLDLTEQGYGYVRTNGYLPAAKDVYVSTSQAKRFALRKGDYIEGEARPPLGSEKYGALLRIEKVSGLSVEEARARVRFEDLTPLFPDVKLKMEQPGRPADITARIIDIISPIGKGQRGLIVSPPKAGKTTVIKQIATSIEANNPDVHLMILLVDERPEEVTDMRRHVKGEVVASTFDRPSEEHTVLAELAIERAKRLVEVGRDVVIILDGITRLARAYNLSAPASGRLTSGGIDQAAIYPPKKFFGAARNIEEGGSLTILATALVETGSKADDVIFEEFKGTGNMELRLDRRLAERRIYPAIDVNASSTRHEELLFERKQLELVYRLRRVLNGLADDGSAARSLELLIEKLKTTKNNDEFLAEVAKAQGQGGSI